MVRHRIQAYRDRIQQELRAAVAEEQTPHQIALSFAIGVFITSLPTLGIGFGVFAVLIYTVSWINKLALFASALVLNPAVKSVVYVASYQIGSLLFSSGPVTTFDVTILNTAATLIRQFLLGNLLIALIFAAFGYAAVYRFTVAYRHSREATPSTHTRS